MVSEHVIDDPQARRPILPAAHSLYRRAGGIGNGSRRHESSAGSILGFDLRRQVLPSKSGRDGKPFEVPGVRGKEGEVRIQARPLIDGRVVSGKADGSAIREHHVAVAVGRVAGPGRPETVLSSEPDLMRTGDIRSSGSEEITGCLKILLIASRKITPQGSLIAGCRHGVPGFGERRLLDAVLIEIVVVQVADRHPHFEQQLGSNVLVHLVCRM